MAKIQAMFNESWRMIHTNTLYFSMNVDLVNSIFSKSISNLSHREHG